MRARTVSSSARTSVCAAIASAAAAQPPQPTGFGAGAPRQGANAAQAGNQPAAAPNALFSIIDADGDGVITKRELRKAVAALKKLDLDKDGNITLAEASGTPAGGAAAGGPATFGGGTGFNNGAGGYGAGDPRSARLLR